MKKFGNKQGLLAFGMLVTSLLSCDHANDHVKKKNSALNDVIAETDSVKPFIPSPDLHLVVIDSANGLMWSKADYAFLSKKYFHSWDELSDWLNEMNTANYAGFSDWRIPSIREYRTINGTSADRKKYRLTFQEYDTTQVWGKGAYAFWSSTTPNANTASYISFHDGFATSGSRGKQMASGPWEGIEFCMSARLVRNLSDN